MTQTTITASDLKPGDRVLVQTILSRTGKETRRTVTAVETRGEWIIVTWSGRKSGEYVAPSTVYTAA